ncbi:MAG TPA: LysE family translocator [Chloroflexia bacterium]|nr:LysE family translocator [Chloroflexia bacterium]
MLPDSSDLLVFLVATLALNLTPGPDMLYVIARSVGQGRTAGIVSALGIGAGIFVHIFAVALGLATLLVSLPLGFEMIKYAGAAYLLYLGIRILVSKEEIVTEGHVRKDNLARIFQQGVITNVLNPKVALFFLAFLPQFVDEARGPIGWQVVALGLLFNISGTLVNVGVALLAGSIGNRLQGRPVFTRAQKWLTGGIFIGLAMRLALLERR